MEGFWEFKSIVKYNDKYYLYVYTIKSIIFTYYLYSFYLVLEIDVVKIDFIQF